MSEILGGNGINGDDEEPIVLETGANYDGVEDWDVLRNLEEPNEGEQ